MPLTVSSSVATSLNNLGLFYRDRGLYAQALPLLRQALAIQEAALGKLSNLDDPQQDQHDKALADAGFNDCSKTNQ